MIDFVGQWSTETERPARRFLGWLGLRASKYFDWKQRYGQANEHNTQVPRDPPQDRHLVCCAVLPISSCPHKSFVPPALGLHSARPRNSSFN